MSITVEKFKTSEMLDAKFLKEPVEVITEKVKLIHSSGDSYTIDELSYESLRRNGKTDLEIFDYIDDIMRD